MTSTETACAKEHDADVVASPPHVDVNGLLEAIFWPALRVDDFAAPTGPTDTDWSPPSPLARAAWSLVRRRQYLRHHDERDLIQELIEYLTVNEWRGTLPVDTLGFDPAKVDPALPPEEALLAYLSACLRRQWKITSKAWTRERRSDYAGGYETVSLDRGWERAEKAGRNTRVMDVDAFDRLRSSRISVSDVASSRYTLPAADSQAAFEALFVPATNLILKGVEEQTREYLLLTILGGMTGEEAAKAVGLSPTVARRRAERAKKERKAALEAMGIRPTVRKGWRPIKASALQKRRTEEGPPEGPAWILDRHGTPIAILEWRPWREIALRKRLPIPWPVMAAIAVIAEPTLEAA